MPGCLIKAFLISTIVASVSFFITHSELLAKPRRLIWNKNDFFGQLLDCCYCLGHWVAAVVLIIFPVRLFGISWPLDYLLTWLVISWVAGLQSLAASQLWGE